MLMSSLDTNLNDDGWWEDMMVSRHVNETVDGSTDCNDTTLDNLFEFHNDCSREFFNQGDSITKGSFFEVCCFTWMQSIFRNKDDSNSVSPQRLWYALKEIYLSGTENSSGIIKWILPDPTIMTSVTLGGADSHDFYDYDNHKMDKECMASLMKFWKQLFHAFEEGSSTPFQTSEVNGDTKRPSKRRRMGLGRSSSVGFSGLLRGRYKLPAVYLLISLMKEVGIASNWERLRGVTRNLPSIFKTVAESDILAGMALVVLANLNNGKPIPGLSTLEFFKTHLSLIDSYGLSILSILQEATGLDLYNLRASICRLILEPIDAGWDSLSEDFKSEVIDACESCIDQDHPGRFVDELQKKEQQAHEKRRRKKMLALKNSSVPEEIMSPGFPLLVHLQIRLLQNKVERAAELTRKIDSSPFLSDEVKEKAWLNIWNYLLVERMLFLDGNISSPGYIKKRDFLYNYMACRVSQKAKLFMMDFYQEVANRVCEHEEVSLEEKQYVTLACQQTVLRLLLKICGLGSDTIRAFIEETTWPVEIPGQSSAKDLNAWGVNFLLETRQIPSSLIDERTGLVDVLKRIDSVSETARKEEHISDRAQSASAITDCSKIVGVELLVDEEPSEDVIDDSNRHRTSHASEVEGTRVSATANNLREEDGSNQNFENDDEEDDDIVVLNDSDDDEVLIIDDGEDDNDSEGVEVVDSDDEEDIIDQHSDLSNGINDNDGYGEDDKVEDIVFDLDGDNNYSDGDENERYEGDNGDTNDEIEISDDDDDDYDAEEIAVEEDDEKSYNKEVQSDDEHDNDDAHAENEGLDNSDDDFDDRLVDDADFMSSAENNKCRGESIEDSGNIKFVVENVTQDPSKTCQAYDTASKSEDAHKYEGVDGYVDVEIQSNSDHNNSNTEDATEKSKVGNVDSEVRRPLDPSPLEGTANNTNEAKNDLVNVFDCTDVEQKNGEKVEKMGTESAEVGAEFGDTTEEEDENERFRANRTAQADRRADALRSGAGYASQVEDGYEPEDTHGYTEEEVSEAIHTEDEEDERILKQKSRLVETVSDADKEEGARVLSEESAVIVGKADRQASAEPASDDMDMADERTEQEEDVGAEFSELEENPEGMSESKLLLSESMPATTLLEFAQKAQMAPVLEDVDENRKKAEDTKDLRSDTEEKSVHQETGDSFDADDEKYATEGCKSLETEDEEDAEKGASGTNFTCEAETDPINDDNKDASEGDTGIDVKPGNKGQIASAAKIPSEDMRSKIVAESTQPLDERNTFASVDGEDVEMSNLPELLVSSSENAQGVKTNQVDEDIDELISIPDNKIVNNLVTNEVREDEMPSSPKEKGICVNGKDTELEISGERKVEANEENSNRGVVGNNSCNDELDSVEIQDDEANHHGKTTDVAIDLTEDQTDEPDAKELIAIQKDSRERGKKMDTNVGYELEAKNDDNINCVKEDYTDNSNVVAIAGKMQSDEDESNPKNVDDPNRNKNIVRNNQNVEEDDRSDVLVKDSDSGEQRALNAKDTELQLVDKTDTPMDESDADVEMTGFNDIISREKSLSNAKGIMRSDGAKDEDVSADKLADTGLKEELSDQNVDGDECTSLDKRSQSQRPDETTSESNISPSQPTSLRKNANAAVSDEVTGGNSPKQTSSRNRAGENSEAKQDEALLSERQSIEIDSYEGKLTQGISTNLRKERVDDDDQEMTDIKDSEEPSSQQQNKSNVDQDYQQSEQEHKSEQPSEEPVNPLGLSVGDTVMALGGKPGQPNHLKITSVNPDGTYGAETTLRKKPKVLKVSQIIEVLERKATNPNLPAIDEEASEINSVGYQDFNDVRDEPPDVPIPEFIGGEPEEETSHFTGQSNRKRKTKHIDNEGRASVSSRSRPSGLPPRPPQKDRSPVQPSKRRNTRSKHIKIEGDDESSVQTHTSTRSTRSATRKSSLRGINTRSDEHNDDDSVRTGASFRSTRSSTRKPTVRARTKDQNEDIGDEGSVLSRTSRSTRSITRRSSVQVTKSNEKDANDDEASALTHATTRSTRSATRKSAAGTKIVDSKTINQIDEDDDDARSVQTRTSTRSTRSTTRRSSVQATKSKGKNADDDEASVLTQTSTRSTRCSSRKSSVHARKAKENNQDEDEQSVLTQTSTKSTRSGVRKLSARVKSLEEIDEDDDDRSVQKRASPSKNNDILSIYNYDDFSTWTKEKLKKELKERGIRHKAKLLKKELVDLLQKSSKNDVE